MKGRGLTFHRIALAIAAVAIFLSSGNPVAAQEVFVEAGAEQRGRGVLRARGTECFVLTPRHVVDNAYRISVVGRNDVRANATVLRGYDADLSILRLTDGDDFSCDPWMPLNNFEGMIGTQTSGTIVLARRDGSREFLSVDITRVDEQYIYVRPTTPDAQISQSNSGGALYVNGALAGLLERTDRVFRLDRIRGLTDEFFSATGREPEPKPALDNMSASSALAILDRVTASRDGSDQGQAQAVAALVANGFDFTGMNWSGLTFRGADLSGGNYASSRMHLIDLSRADAKDASFLKAGLRFAKLEGLRAQDANFSESYAPFVDAAGAIFDGANLSYANLLGGDFRGASFRNATLRGASFAFADLRGAVFDNANLADAHFAGAIFDETTSFVGAIVNNTDFQGAAAATLDLSRADVDGAGPCRGPVRLRPGYTGLTWRITLRERWPASNTPTGLQFEDLRAKGGGLAGFGDSSLSLCDSSAKIAPSVYLANPGEETIMLDRAYLAKRDRRRAVVERVDRQLELLEANLGDDRILKGSGRQVESWAKHVRDAARRVELLSKPYMNGEHFIALYLAKGLIVEDDIDANRRFWERLAETRFRLESSIAAMGGDHAHYDGWAVFFPPGSVWENLPEDKIDLYRRWVLGRGRHAPMRLVTHVPVRPCERCRVPTPGEHRLGIVFPSIPPGQTYVRMDSWSRDERRLAEQMGVALDRIFQVSTGNLTTLLMLPEPIDRYRVTLPDGLSIPDDAWFELDLDIVEIRGDDRARMGMGNVAVAVEPGEVRLVTPRGVAWTTALQLAEPG